MTTGRKRRNDDSEKKAGSGGGGELTHVKTVYGVIVKHLLQENDMLVGELLHDGDLPPNLLLVRQLGPPKPPPGRLVHNLDGLGRSNDGKEKKKKKE